MNPGEWNIFLNFMILLFKWLEFNHNFNIFAENKILAVKGFIAFCLLIFNLMKKNGFYQNDFWFIENEWCLWKNFKLI